MILYKISELVLSQVHDNFETFTCEEHKVVGPKFANRTLINIYFNNRRKVNTDSVVADRVKGFKQRQRHIEN